MALAIVSLSLITMLGLIPVGLMNLRHAIDSTTEAEIVKQLSAQIRLTPFNSLMAYQDTSFFYDEEGNYLTSGTSLSAAPAQTRYWVTTIQGAPVYPGSDNAPALSQLNSNVKMITLEFVSGPDVHAAVLTTNNYVVLVPNSGN